MQALKEQVLDVDAFLQHIVTAVKAGKHTFTKPNAMCDEYDNTTGKSALLYIPVGSNIEAFIVYSTGEEVGICSIRNTAARWLFKKSEMGAWSGLRLVERPGIHLSVSDIYNHVLQPVRRHLV